MRPLAPPQAWLEFIGEYGPEESSVCVFEGDGSLWLLAERGEPRRLAQRRDPLRFVAAGSGGEPIVLSRQSTEAPALAIGDRRRVRRHVGPSDGHQMKIEPVRPVAGLLKEAMASAPPEEGGAFHDTMLVDIVSLDATIGLDVRYATTNNFLGHVFYAEPRACLQRPAAEAVVRAHGRLQEQGYGLLIHDAYRPWYVTKVFWEAMPEATRWLVADPSRGSRHNRGAAVDLTLCELSTGRAIEMPSTFDEITPRANASYPGGTGLQRWHRALLRQAMEAEGFTVNPDEWWHFDWNRWRDYRLGNVPLDRFPFTPPAPATVPPSDRARG